MSSLSSNGSLGSMTGPGSQLDAEILLEYDFKPPSKEKLQIEERDRESELQRRESSSNSNTGVRSRDTDGDEKSVKEKRVRNAEINYIISADSNLTSKASPVGNPSVLDRDSNIPYREASNSLESKEHSAEILKLLTGGIENDSRVNNTEKLKFSHENKEDYADKSNPTSSSHSRSQRNILQDREDRLESRSKRIDLVTETLLVLSFLALPLLLTSILSCLAFSCLVVSCLVLSNGVLSCLFLSCGVLSCGVLFCLMVSCIAFSCLVVSCLVLSNGVFSCLFLSCGVLSCLV